MQDSQSYRDAIAGLKKDDNGIFYVNKDGVAFSYGPGEFGPDGYTIDQIQLNDAQLSAALSASSAVEASASTASVVSTSPASKPSSFTGEASSSAVQSISEVQDLEAEADCPSTCQVNSDCCSGQLCIQL
jgi:hypothetical protein